MGNIIVIGGANIDICGASIEPLRNFDSNPGTIAVAFGGVGRNIAEYAALLGEEVKFVTVFSDDNYGTLLRKDCERLGIDTAFCSVTKDYPSSMYIAILDFDHDMRIAMSDMRILRAMREEMIADVLKSASKDDIIIIDANLETSIIRKAAEEAPCMVACDPVSVSKTERVRDVIGKTAIFKPNRYEAEYLTGIAIEDDHSMREVLDWFLDRGVKEVLISLGSDGVLLGTPDRKIHLAHRRVDVENATGGGDSLLAAYTSARRRRLSPEEAARFAVSCAVSVIERSEKERKKISRELIEKNLPLMEIKEWYL